MGKLLLVVSGFFFFIGALGTLRFKDVFSRLHASSKCSVTAFLFLFASSPFFRLTPGLYLKISLILILQAVTVPISTHLIALSARNLYLTKRST